MSLLCGSPFRIRDEYGELAVRCGRCMPCRIWRARIWTVRLTHELDTHNNTAVFLTATYSDEHIPQHYTLVKKHLQNYFKRLRKEGLKFKYYAVGEYGARTHRPHYHAIILGLSLLQHYEPLTRQWSYGFTKIGTVTSSSINYVTGYICDKFFTKNTKEYYSPRIPPFQLQSQGMGKDYLLSGKLDCDASLGYMYYNGRKVPLPRYYRKVLGAELDAQRIQDAINEEIADWFDKHNPSRNPELGFPLRLDWRARFRNAQATKRKMEFIAQNKKKL